MGLRRWRSKRTGVARVSLQHPQFEYFKQALAQSRTGEALQHLDALLLEYPESAALHWHRAQVLDQLGRKSDASAALDALLLRRPDYPPAIALRARLDLELDQPGNSLPARAAPRPGERESGAFRARRSDPDEAIIERILDQIGQALDEPPPQLTAVDASGFPEYQRQFNARCQRELSQLGMHRIADAEAEGLRPSLGQRVLISCFADSDGEVGVISFSFEPTTQRRANPISRWLRSADQAFELTECSTGFDDGAHLTTICGNEPAYAYGPPLYIECLPARTSLAELVTRHSGRIAAYRRQHPGAQAIPALDLAGYEQRWIASQQARKAYRQTSGYLNESELRALLGPDYARYARRVRDRLR